ncbi:RNA 2'-phosphotransferase [Streptomyces sp. NPDC056411]|uniref:RNA 2'-phosphotransferase n=1 Tax=Streptomyces sp. NPDC056411 TaxID=3345813 RepID=UPI0035DD15EE
MAKRLGRRTKPPASVRSVGETEGADRPTETAPSTLTLTSLLEARFPEIVQLLRWVGCDSVKERVDEWKRLRGEFWVSEVLDPKGRPGHCFTAWRDVLDATRKSILLLEMLVFESSMGTSTAAVSWTMPTGLRYDKTLHVVRQRVALALWEHALSINWRRPVVFCRALRLARIYLTDVVGADELTDSGGRFQFSGRLGQATVLMARFEPASIADLEAATERIRGSIAEGNPAADAVPYLLEGYLRLHDQTGNRRYLGEALSLDEEFSDVDRSTSWMLHTAEAWLRLADGLSKSDERFSQYLERAEQALTASGDGDGVDAAQHAVQRAVLDCVAAAARRTPSIVPRAQLGLRHLKNPFGLGEQLLRFAECAYPAVTLPAELVEELDRRFGSSTEPLHRRLLSDCLRAYTQICNASEQERDGLLRKALDLQEGRGGVGPLTDELSRMRYADDLLETARLQSSRKLWSAGVASLIRETVQNSTSCVPLVRLGREVEKGLPVSQSDQQDLHQRLNSVSGAARWIRAVAEGDSDSFYKEAADRAVISPDLMRRNLGGRSNVVTIEDYLGFTSSTLVFKPTTMLCFERDKFTSYAVAETLQRMKAKDRFGIIDFITTMRVGDLEHGKEQFQAGTEIITVRRFEHGTVLAERLSVSSPAESFDLLAHAAEFLALIHASDSRDEEPRRVRRAVLGELRKWLKAVMPDQFPESVNEISETWWLLLDSLGLPPQPRRDAHAYNWLVTDDARIIAVDLEAAFWRPMGYELAQLTDDVPAIPVDRWDLRRQIVDRYIATLLASQRDCPALAPEKVWDAYRVSLLARAVRRLSDRTSEPASLEHAEALLDELSKRAEWELLRDLAIRVRDAWAQRRGASGSAPLEQLNDSRRRRVSRALSYQLRHSRRLAADAQGWLSIDDVVRALGETGDKVTAEELVIVARAVDEARFEVDGRQIRARYGHSQPTSIDYEIRPPDGQLYHCTPTTALNNIFQHGAGLKPMTRQWVHLTTDRATALSAGRRHGPCVLLSMADPARHGLEFRHAGGTTWLVEHVPPDALTVVPLHRLFSTH